ncbi:prephenate dehydrogenase [Pontibacter ummariensis]|uniref:Prephenate dehydrogenase n=1 Tax=Pontibacter ummariensis TaxID=1610492 RepID=A0A239BSD1_9BACT|nr:prephenate dehydrogenase [Pontibacter ummariensis]PRY15684.1 prephenate dehydrogenase [Pontibacter ummariensis]SNS10053.1 prephenate dehydrogenase [Pontibacter ummariensis]
MKLCVIGLGLLGGSFALAVKAIHKNTFVLGVDANPAHGQRALERGIADEVLPLPEALKQSDLVVLATPVDVIYTLLPEVLDLIPDQATVVDLGSTKDLLCQVVAQHPKRGQFVAAHPIAGTEYSGPDAAFASLLEHKTMIICEREKSGPASLALVEELCRDLQMPLRYMGAKEHDLHLAYVSHLSHISSFALGLTVLDKEQDEKNIFDMAGSGFSSTVRLAKSSPAMWGPIFAQNKKNVSEALESYIRQLQEFKATIDKDQQQEAKELMAKANEIRRILG